MLRSMARLSSGAATRHIMGQRIAYGTLAIVLVVLLFGLDIGIARWATGLEGAVGALLARGSLLPLFFLVMLLGGASELVRLLRVRAVRPHAVYAHSMIAVLVLTPWLSAAGWLSAGNQEAGGLYWQAIWVVVAVVGAGILVVIRRAPEGTFRDIGATLLVILHLGYMGSFGLLLRCGSTSPGQEGAWLLLAAVLVTKASDIGAFFVGSAFGRHPLMPAVSPGKSIEGVIGGLAGSGLAAILITSISLPESFGIEHELREALPGWRAVLFGLCLSVAGQLGDLVESCFKRDASIKDSGEMIPCFGGILDLIDSPVLAMPVAWFLLTMVWNVV